MSERDEIMEKIKVGEIPDDLQWMVREYKLQPNDPAFLLLLWHWQRMGQVHDRLHEEAKIFRGAVENNIEKAHQHLREWQGAVKVITEFQQKLSTVSRDMNQRLENGLLKPINDSLVASQQLEAQLNGLLTKIDGRNKQSTLHIVIGCILSGFAAGAVFIPWTCSLLFTR